VKKKRERRVSLIAVKSILGGAEQWWVLFIVLKQGGHKGVDNWPWPGGHSTLSSPTLFMVDY
jgi:hypothetical protein